MTKSLDKIVGIITQYGITVPRGTKAIGDGWLFVIDKAFEDMIAAGWDKDLRSIKNKYGELKIYIGGGNRLVYNLILDAEGACAEMCEKCGNQHGLIPPLEGDALCLACENKTKMGELL